MSVNERPRHLTNVRVIDTARLQYALAFTPVEAAAVANVSTSVIDRAIEAGDLEVRCVDSQVLVTRQEITRWFCSLPTSSSSPSAS